MVSTRPFRGVCEIYALGVLERELLRHLLGFDEVPLGDVEGLAGLAQLGGHALGRARRLMFVSQRSQYLQERTRCSGMAKEATYREIDLAAIGVAGVKSHGLLDLGLFRCARHV
jgi:hypothetical protein